MAETRRRVAIIGAGAIGATLAVHLARARRCDLVVCARAPLEEIVVATPPGELTARPAVVTRPEDLGDVAWGLLATKAHDTAGAHAWLEALGRCGARVAVLQNGVEHEARVRPFVGPSAVVVPVVVSCSADCLGAGRARQRTFARLTVPDDAPGGAFAELVAGPEVEVVLAPDFKSEAWRKLCANVAGGAITALTGQTNGVLRRPDVAAVARELVRETVLVGRAEGARLRDDLDEIIVTAMQRAPENGAPSILQDVRARRRLEVDARNGVVVRLGEKHDIPTPLNRMAVALLTAMSDAFG